MPGKMEGKSSTHEGDMPPGKAHKIQRKALPLMTWPENPWEMARQRNSAFGQVNIISEMFFPISR
jgi:hypothetical protein